MRETLRAETERISLVRLYTWENLARMRNPFAVNGLAFNAASSERFLEQTSVAAFARYIYRRRSENRIKIITVYRL